MNRSLGVAPDHPVLPAPHGEWEIVGLCLQNEPADGAEPRLDLTVRRGHDRRVLRFLSPQDLSVGPGGLSMTHGFEILDVRSRGMDGIGVRVDDYESSPGGVRFWARTVEDVTLYAAEPGAAADASRG